MRKLLRLVTINFTLARYGILGESRPRLKLRWN